ANRDKTTVKPLIALALNLLWPAVADKEDNNAANLKEDAPSVVAEAIADKEFPSNGGVPALIVWHKANGLNEGDLTKLQELTASLESDPLPYQTSVVPFHQLPPQALSAQLSEDQSTLVMPLFFEEDQETDQLKEGTAELEKRSEQLLGSNPFQTAIQSG
ncbi:MMPL family transporter, partial [Clostridium perfringens]